MRTKASPRSWRRGKRSSRLRHSRHYREPAPERFSQGAGIHFMSLQKLLNPRSIAIVGASDKIGPGFNAWNALTHVGFGGRVYLVNPGKAELLGQKCYPALDAIDGDIDAAFVAVKAESVLEVATQ